MVDVESVFIEQPLAQGVLGSYVLQIAVAMAGAVHVGLRCPNRTSMSNRNDQQISQSASDIC